MGTDWACLWLPICRRSICGPMPTDWGGRQTGLLSEGDGGGGWGGGQLACVAHFTLASK